MSIRPRRLRSCLVKEELFTLTGNALSARILHQMLYWTERVKDVDDLLTEEMERSRMTGGTPVDFPLAKGWIYKKADELKIEVLADESEATVRRRLQELVKAGWLHERHNPEHRWDKTLQYRLNFIQLVKDLHKIGYRLDGYTYSDELMNLHDDSPNLHGEDSTAHHAGAIPEITTDITTKTTTKISPASRGGKKKASSSPDTVTAKPKAGSKKEPTEEGRAASAIVARYAELLGYPIAHPGKEASVARKMVQQGYTTEDMEGCYRTMISQPFWQKQGITLYNVLGKLGAWKAQQSKSTPSRPVGIRTPEERAAKIKRLIELNPTVDPAHIEEMIPQVSILTPTSHKENP